MDREDNSTLNEGFSNAELSSLADQSPSAASHALSAVKREIHCKLELSPHNLYTHRYFAQVRSLLGSVV